MYFLIHIIISSMSSVYIFYSSKPRPVSCGLGLVSRVLLRSLTLILSINTYAVIVEHLRSVSHLQLKDLVSVVNTYSNLLAKFCFVSVS